jgi:hypothetical protein
MIVRFGFVFNNIQQGMKDTVVQARECLRSDKIYRCGDLHDNTQNSTRWFPIGGSVLPFHRLHRPVLGRDTNDQAALTPSMMAG